jgi:hypothetical protein
MEFNGGGRIAVKRFIIREALLTDYDDIVAFYEENPDPHVMLRGEPAVRSAIRNGTFFLAIDNEATNAGRIFAVSAVYDVASALDGGGTIRLKEAGGSSVKAEYRGFHIHRIFHAARSLHEFILDRGGFDEYFGAIIIPNDPSVKNIGLMGFEPWANPPRALVDERLAYATPPAEVAFFRLGIQALPLHAELLLNYLSIGHVSRVSPESGELEQVELVLSIETIKRYKPQVLKIAAGELSEWEER